MKTLLLIFTILLASDPLASQTTSIPDANFEQALINFGFDSGVPDGFVQTASIDTITRIYLNNKSISDLTGIEDFTSLVELKCSYNQLTSIDLSKNTALKEVYCSYNQLSSVDISQNVVLTYLNCNHNQLTSIDVTQNLTLTELHCEHNKLTNLDVTQNTALLNLVCNHNQLTSIDVSQNLSLRGLDCASNQITNLDVTPNAALIGVLCGANLLTNLDVSQNIALQQLQCNDNQLTAIDVTQNPNLEQLYCNDNEITSLDISQNPLLFILVFHRNKVTMLDASVNSKLTTLTCSDNLLTCLRLKDASALGSFKVLNNPDLTCISIDDTSIVQNQNNWHIDSNITFSTDCMDSCTISALTVNETTNSNSYISIYPNPTNGQITIELNEFSAYSTMTLFNNVGQIIYAKNVEDMKQIGFEIDAPSGLYFLKLDAESGKNKMIKIIKE